MPPAANPPPPQLSQAHDESASRGASASGSPPVIVLAAGRGTRMGGPKLFMQVLARPWWQIQVQRLNLAAVQPIWVVGDAFELPPGLDPAVRTSSDAPMFESVRAGLRAVMQTVGHPPVSRPFPPGVFILPVDVPAPRPSVWAALAAEASKGRPAVPTCRGAHGHPLLLPWDWALELSDAPAGSRLDELIRDDLLEVQVADGSVLDNLNTPEDVERWSELNADA